MSNQQILAKLREHEIRTLGDLDHYASVRAVSRWHALAMLIGVDAADRVLDALRARIAQREAIA